MSANLQNRIRIMNPNTVGKNDSNHEYKSKIIGFELLPINANP